MRAALLVASALSLEPGCATRNRVGTSSPAAILFADAFAPPASLGTFRRLDRNHQYDGLSPLPFDHSVILPAKPGRPGRSEEERETLYKKRKEQLKEVLCLDQKGIDKLVRANPRVLLFRVKETVVPKVAMLQERLEIDQKTAGKILSVPFIFSQSATTMLQKIDWLQDRMNLDIKTIARNINSTPWILGQRVETLEEKIRFIGNSLDLADNEVAEMISKYPAILPFNVNENIPPMMSYLQKRFEIDAKSLKETLQKNPRLLPMSIEKSIEPKLVFYGALIGEKRAKRLVMESTNLLIVSLEKKLKPRLAEVQKSGVKIDWDDTLIRRLARRTNEEWERYKLEDVMAVRQREREQNNT